MVERVRAREEGGWRWYWAGGGAERREMGGRTRRVWRVGCLMVWERRRGVRRLDAMVLVMVSESEVGLERFDTQTPTS